MTDLFKNKYRIQTTRLQNWDYGNNAPYFITVCAKNRFHYFGEIENNEMNLNEIGSLAEHFWKEIPIKFPYAKLDDFIVMPNHIHGILFIEKPVETQFIASNIDNDFNSEETRLIASNSNNDLQNVETQFIASNIDNDFNSEETRLIASLQGGITKNMNPMLNENISRIIRWYKGRCSFEIRKLNINFDWQPRFHDHIIRDSNSFERIKNYIVNNPYSWETDILNIKTEK
jgi:REP element-mobilizing transposase RayT